MGAAAEWVWGARRGAGLSQRQLAKRSGVPQPTIARIERGQQIPRVDTLMRLLDACDFELRLGPKRGRDVDVSLIELCIFALRATPADPLKVCPF